MANLPYNVATPLVCDLLDGVPAIDRMLVMVQREVGERLAAAPGDPAYGIPSVKVAYWATARVVGRVPPTVFLPQPRVESVAGAHPAPPRTRRWTATWTGCSPWCGPGSVNDARCCAARWPTWSTRAAFEAAGVRPDARPEELGIEDWGRLTDAVTGRPR